MKMVTANGSWEKARREKLPPVSPGKKTIHPKGNPATSDSFLSFLQWSDGYVGDEFLLKPRTCRVCKLEHKWFHDGANVKRKLDSLL